MRQPKERHYISEEDIQHRAAMMAAELLQVQEERDALREELAAANRMIEDINRHRELLVQKLKRFAEGEDVLRKHRDSLMEQHDALQKENEDLKSDVAIRAKKIDELQVLLDRAEKERGLAHAQLMAARRANDSLREEIQQLKAQAMEAHGQFQTRVQELQKDMDDSAALLKLAQDERDTARRENHNMCCIIADYKAQFTAQEEVIERLKAQNSNFCEEQREAKQRAAEAKQRAASLAADMARAREEVARLVELSNKFKDRLEDVKREKNAVVEISNGFARERDALQADYDARGKVIKKLRKRLHKLKKKLKH